MRILVVSDSHGDFNNLHSAILNQPSAEVVFCLGDGEYDYDAVQSLFPNKMFVIIRGNCDTRSNKPDTKTINIEDKCIFATHGHLYRAKFDLHALYFAGKEADAQIILFGHTHTPYNEYVNGVYMLNPGSIKGYYGTYGTIDISKSGIVMNIIKLNKLP